MAMNANEVSASLLLLRRTTSRLAAVMRFSQATALFGILLAPALTLGGCGQMQTEIDKAAIQGVLHETGLTGTARSDEHVTALKTIDISHCPQDFRDGYVRFIHAWEEEAAVQKAKARIDAEQEPAALAGVLATMFNSAETPWGDHLSAETQLADYQKQADTDLDGAAQALNDLARRHGVNITS